MVFYNIERGVINVSVRERLKEIIKIKEGLRTFFGGENSQFFFGVRTLRKAIWVLRGTPKQFVQLLDPKKQREADR